MGGILQFPWHSESHLTEDSPLVTAANRQSLWETWSPYWNQSAHLLVEKSPRHMTMTRYLQAIFTPEQSRFVAVLRHPFGAWHWAFSNRWEYTNSNCGIHHVLQRLKLYEDLAADLHHVQHAVVFQYEQLTNSSLPIVQALVDRLFTRVGLSPTVSVSMDHSNKLDVKRDTVIAQFKAARPGLFDADGNFKEGETKLHQIVDEHLEKLTAMRSAKREANAKAFAEQKLMANAARAPKAPAVAATRGEPLNDGTVTAVEDLIAKYRQGQLDDSKVAGRRRLLGYWGGERTEVKIHAGTTFEWADDWEDNVDMSSPQCKQLVSQFETRVNRLGYSLVNLRHYERSSLFDAWLLER
jgi:hypothetical protein